MSERPDRVARIGFARDMARKLIRQHKVKGPPVPVADLARAVGLEVKARLGWPESVSGILLARDRILGYNGRHHPRRQRFTIAHELGHFVLAHHERYDLLLGAARASLVSGLMAEEEDEGGPIDRAVKDALGEAEPIAASLDEDEGLGPDHGPVKSEADWEANSFAGELLVPLQWLKADWRSIGNAEHLAARYGVSREVLFIRLQECRLL